MVVGLSGVLEKYPLLHVFQGIEVVGLLAACGAVQAPLRFTMQPFASPPVCNVSPYRDSKKACARCSDISYKLIPTRLSQTLKGLLGNMW